MEFFGADQVVGIEENRVAAAGAVQTGKPGEKQPAIRLSMHDRRDKSQLRDCRGGGDRRAVVHDDRFNVKAGGGLADAFKRETDQFTAIVDRNDDG